QTDVQPVFDTILRSAVRLLRGHTGALTRVSGGQLELAARTSTGDAGNASLEALFPQPLQSEIPHAQAIRARAPINIADSQTDPRMPDAFHASARARGFRSWITVPLLRHDEAIGTIAVTRPEAGAFTDDEITLLQTFADQAVIAIENVRLFNETKEALEQQTATSEILGVISRSPTDIQPVLDAVAENAARVCGADDALILRIEGSLLRRAAHYGAIPSRPIPEPFAISRQTVAGRAVLERRTLHIEDVVPLLDSEFPAAAALIIADGARTVVA